MGWKHGTLLVFGNQEKLDGLISGYKAGLSMNALAEQYGASAWAVRNALVQSGVTVNSKLKNPPNKMSDADVQKAIELYKSGLTFAEAGKALGRSETPVSAAIYRICPEIVRPPTGPGSSRWKTGRGKDGNGYIYVWVSPDDPMISMVGRKSGSSHYVYEHRLVMARKLGRPLLRTETVHHINGDRIDNRPENLELRQGKHGKHVAMCCLDCGSRNIGHVGLD